VKYLGDIAMDINIQLQELHNKNDTIGNSINEGIMQAFNNLDDSDREYIQNEIQEGVMIALVDHFMANEITDFRATCDSTNNQDVANTINVDVWFTMAGETSETHISRTCTIC